MRIAYYAPLKSPTHSVPSGDRVVGRLFFEALERAGHEVNLVSTLRTYEPNGDPERQERLREEGVAEARDLIARWSGERASEAPDLWFTYHVYYKAPDWLGPMVSEALGVPYVIAEASYAPKRAAGPWAIGHAAAARSIRAASLILCPTRDDVQCVRPLVGPPGTVEWLPPFLDAAPYQSAGRGRAVHRDRLAREHDLDSTVPWIVVVAMMRAGDKEASYRMLVESLGRLTDIPWQVVIAGDGAARGDIEKAFEGVVPGRARFLGEQGSSGLAKVYAACDLCLWPAVNEAYGMAMLEAQAAGLPVVSRSVRGVPDVVCDGLTGLLALPADKEAFVDFARQLLVNPSRRLAMGRAAAQFAGGERGLEFTAARLGKSIADLATSSNRRPGAIRK